MIFFCEILLGTLETFPPVCTACSVLIEVLASQVLLTEIFNFFDLTETCRDVLCPGSSTCVVDQTNNAYCVTCNRICPEVTSPEQYLCGNDGIIYASACHLRRATCLLGRSIGVAYEGKCISKSATGHFIPSDGPPPETDFEYCSVCSPLGQLCSYSFFILPTFHYQGGLELRVFCSCSCLLKK